MYDALSSIERNYGCVAEYNRCRQESDERDWELREKANEHYWKNREKRESAAAQGKKIVWYDGGGACNHCTCADSDTQITKSANFFTLS